MSTKTYIAAALVAGLASPAAASTLLDFTSSGIGISNTTGTVAGVGYTISGSGTLTDATHKNNNGCNVGFTFACNAPTNDKYDVGFGVKGDNDNEIDGMKVSGNEYVQVKFDRAVRLLGFAGMLTYNGSQDNEGTEQVRLDYSSSGGAFISLFGDTQNTDADVGGGNDSFGTVGLSYKDGLWLEADTVRFYAYGTGTYDDGNANVTAAALQVAPVPLPAAGFLLFGALGGLAAMRRRKKAA